MLVSPINTFTDTSEWHLAKYPGILSIVKLTHETTWSFISPPPSQHPIHWILFQDTIQISHLEIAPFYVTTSPQGKEAGLCPVHISNSLHW
jgi:hypothetical protein